jgi:hypothetical protein
MIFGKAGVAQLVEYKLPKLGVAGSNPVARSIKQTTESRIQTTAGRRHEKKYFQSEVCVCAPLI